MGSGFALDPERPSLGRKPPAPAFRTWTAHFIQHAKRKRAQPENAEVKRTTPIAVRKKKGGFILGGAERGVKHTFNPTPGTICSRVFDSKKFERSAWLIREGKKANGCCPS